ncbi:MAG TPA: arginine--tRNA ligase [Deltaproteobacteria bacterium]|nr:arginine--tRNA ligase [Deltaproteobacteria bacterium]HBG72604.1 arginine--tRNA ligase [Deltaproteobacteria bacterium]
MFPSRHRLDARQIVESLVFSAVRKKIAEWGADTEVSVSIEIPRQESYGDFSTNAAMQLAGKLGRKPRAVAEEIVSVLREEDRRGRFASLSIAGPGFINIVLSEEFWREIIAVALEKGPRFGASTAGEGKTVHLEFVSANPTGPLHVGHGRGAAVGDALARILEFTGHKVVREYYINDVGNQMDNLGRSLLARYRTECGRDAALPEDGYRGEYMIELAGDLRREVGDRYADSPEEEVLPLFRKEAGDRILRGIREDLASFRVTYDRWFAERVLHDRGLVAAALADLRERGQLYESEGATYFRSQALGDEKDRVLVRADGRTTYFAADIAYHRHKLREGFSRMIDIWGADHHGYVARLRAALQGLGEDENRLEVLLVQFVTLIRDGKAVQMSTRSGEFTTLREVLDEVGVDAARFFYLLRSFHTHLDFDLTLAKTQSRNNPVYYIQYVHARICSIFREAEARSEALSGHAPLSILSFPEEVRLMKVVARFPDVISESAKTLEPHRIPFYLLEVADLFHAFYHRHRFLGESPERTQARLALALAVKTVVASGLSLIGVTAPERM